MKATKHSSSKSVLHTAHPGRTHPHKGLSVRVKILLAFLLFTILTMGLLWLMQVVFLDQIYRTIKIRSLEDSADEVIAAVGGDDLYDCADSLSNRYGLTLLLFYPETGSLTRLASASPLTGMGRELTAEDCMQLVMLAEKEGGTYLRTEEFDGNRLPHGSKDPQNQSSAPSPNKDALPAPSDEDAMEVVTYTALFEAEEGVTAALILRTVITPISAARDTIFFVLMAASVLLTLLAILLAIFIARTVVRPIEQINKGAHRLADGDYSYRFPETGSYREAGELAATLNHASEELSKVDSLRRELIANVSHDLRTPLTLISGYSEVMRDLPGEITPENLQTIIDESARLTSLVNDMLEISKIQSGNLNPILFPFSISEMLRESVATYKNLATCQGYHFTLWIDQEVTVNGDRAMLVRALNNLINNALTYTGEDRKIGIRQITTASRVRIEVTDTGAGIPQDKLQDIWDRYYKVDTEHKRSAVGTGLGLSIVKSIISLHGGSWGVRSSNGYGSTFWFELSRESDDAPKAI